MQTETRDSKELAVTQLAAPVMFVAGVFAVLSALSALIG